MEGQRDTSGRGQQREPQAASSALAPQAISLPEGGGAIRGIGEKFAVTPATGTASMTVPITTSPGHSGFGPQLVLTYDSAAGNGPFGFGSHLPLPSISTAMASPTC
jgi:Salmonella virulence plasmid 65kDa B protein